MLLPKVKLIILDSDTADVCDIKVPLPSIGSAKQDPGRVAWTMHMI